MKSRDSLNLMALIFVLFSSVAIGLVSAPIFRLIRRIKPEKKNETMEVFEIQKGVFLVLKKTDS